MTAVVETTVTDNARIRSAFARKLEKQLHDNLDRIAQDTDAERAAWHVIDVIETIREWMSEYGDLRQSVFLDLRDEGWTLGDLAKTFGITRARAAQICTRNYGSRAAREKGREKLVERGFDVNE